MHTQIRLTIFDLDGTLTPIESTWRYLHEALGTWDTGSLSASDYWEGRIDYHTWARRDAQSWRGISLAEVERIVGDIPYSDGAHETVAELKQAGISVGLVSSGISMLASRAARELGFDFAIANRLLHQEGKLTGEVVVEVPLEKKAAIMQEMAERLGVPFTSCATIGDTAYDLPLTSALRIAFKPRDVQTARQADAVVRGSNLRGVLEHIIQRS